MLLKVAWNLLRGLLVLFVAVQMAPSKAQEVFAEAAAYGPSPEAQLLDIDRLDFKYAIGLDAWKIGDTVDTGGLSPAAAAKKSVALKRGIKLPDATSVWPYREVSPWAYAQGSYQFDRPWSARFSLMANQTYGGRVDELSVDYALSPRLGLRGGVVDYKLSWCRDYEANRPWIFDINDFCIDKTNKQLTAGSPGIQLYLNLHTEGFQMQAVGGIYDPKILSYDDYENGRAGSWTQSYIGIDSPTDSNKKHGISLNALHLNSGTEVRFGWLASDIKLSYDPTKYGPLNSVFNIGIDERRTSDAYYVAASFPIGNAINMNVSYTRMLIDLQTNFATIAAYTGDLASHTNLALQMSYLFSSLETITVGLSSMRSIKQARYTAYIDGPYEPENYIINDYQKTVISVSWLRKWKKHWSTMAQFLHVEYSEKLPVDVIFQPDVYKVYQPISNALVFRLAYSLN